MSGNEVYYHIDGDGDFEAVYVDNGTQIYQSSPMNTSSSIGLNDMTISPDENTLYAAAYGVNQVTAINADDGSKKLYSTIRLSTSRSYGWAVGGKGVCGNGQLSIRNSRF